GPGEGVIDEGGDVAGAIARVVPLAVELEGPDRLAPSERADRVDEPDLASPPGRLGREDAEDGRLEDVAMDGREVARRVRRRGLFDHRGDPERAAFGPAGGHAVAAG